MYIKIYFFIIIPEYNKIEKQSGRVCVFQSLVLSFILGGIIVLTFALVDEKIYQEHRFPYIFLLSTFYLVIHNTTNEITFDIRKIYEEGYSTKGENRGLGLNNVRKILANYGTMFLETELQGNRFLQVLKIGGYEQE